ncbi:MAG: hypothetical protein RL434_1677 [Pseudomonadota bacterium]
MHGFFKAWWRVVWNACALLLALAALLSLTLRATLPQLESETAAVETWVGRALGLPVAIEGLEVHWHRGQPALGADGIRVYHQTDPALEVLRFKRAEAGLDLFGSLRHGQLRLGNLRLTGLELDLLWRADGRLVIDGFIRQDPRFLRWLIAQDELEITASRVTLRDERQRFQPVSARAVTIRVDRRRGHTELALEALEVDAFASGLRATAKLPKGDAADPGATLAIFAQGLDGTALQSWLQSDNAPLPPMKGDLWLEARRGEAGGAQLRFVLEKVELGADAAADAAAPAQLGIQGLADVGAGHVTAQVVQIATSADGRQAVDWRLRWQEDAGDPRSPQLVVSADSIPLPLLNRLQQWVPEHATKAPWPSAGNLENLRLARLEGSTGGLYAAGELQDLTLPATERTPGTRNLRAEFRMNGRGGVVWFDDAEFELTHPERLLAPLTLANLNGHVLWQKVGETGQQITTRLEGSANTLPLRLNAAWQEGPGQSPKLSLDAHLGTGDLSQLSGLLPAATLKSGAERWLRAAFPAGVLRSAHIELEGVLANFPFENSKSGEFFRAQAAVEDVTLKYASVWPEATGVAGEVTVAGRTLTGTLTAARFGQSPLKTARLRLGDLLSPQPVLEVTGEVQASLDDIARTLGASPLRERAMPQLQGLTLSGTTQLTLDMSLGLKKGMQRTVKGTLGFAGNTLVAASYGLTLEDLQGALAFAGNDWESRELRGSLAGRTVDLEISGGPSNPEGVQFALAGTADQREVLSQLAARAPTVHAMLARDPSAPALQGSLRWRGRLSGETGQRRLLLESSLVGMRLDLPPPLGKPAPEPLPLALDLPLQGEGARETRVALGEILQAALRQEPVADGTRRLTHLAVRLGSGPAPDLARAGIHIEGELAALPLGEWAGLIKTEETGSPALPVEMDVTIGSLTTLGQDFAKVRLRGQRDPSAWRVSVDSARMAGDITIPRDSASSPLTLNLQRLWLQSPAADRKGQAKLVPQRIPRVAMACASFHYNKLDLGQASLATTPTAQGLHLDSLVFQSETAQIRAQGDWFLRDDTHESRFSIEVKAEALGALLGSFGYEARAIKDGRTNLEIEAGWPGTPGDFTLDRLTGSLNLNVRRGRLLDIEPGSGRLFGLLSLQTLPRRLSLDFADLFSKGYAFDRIEGWFRLENGNAYTNTLFMEGPSSRVEVTGRTGLASKDYDQKAIVTPALSKSIPLASAVFGPAGIGAGAAIYLGQKLFKGVPTRVDKFLQRRYSITGPWDKPVVEKL